VISVTMVNNGARQSLRRTCFNWLVTEFIEGVSQFVSQVGIRVCLKGSRQDPKHHRGKPRAACDRATLSRKQKFRRAFLAEQKCD
jgi:hypothetical protein